MIDNLAKNIVELLAKRLTSQTIGAALAFWLTGMTLYLLTRPVTTVGCVAPYSNWWCQLRAHGPVGIGVLGALAIGAVMGSAAVTAASTPLVTDIVLATRWPGRRGLRTLGTLLTQLRAARRDRLWVARDKAMTISDPLRRTAVLAVISEKARRYPRESGDNDLTTATGAGNALRAAMYRIENWSGLELATCWRPLVAVLPDNARTAVANTATVVFIRSQLLVFAIASAAWWPLLGWRWAPVLIAVTVLLTLITLRGIRNAVADYADEVEAVVRIHRFALYDAVGLRRPKNSMNERTRGIELTRLLQARNDRPVAYAPNQP